jgi:type I restriction enzyme S subunit
LSAKKVAAGEVVLNRMRTSMGLVAVADRDGLVSPDYAVFVPADGTSALYFGHLFRTSLLQAVFRSESRGLGTGSSGFLRLNSEDFLSLPMPVPPWPEQDRVATRIESMSARTAGLVQAAERSIALLRERRGALISAAVSGELDLGG